jgi:hypothetical protein
VPLELDTLCVGALGHGDGSSRVHTAAAVHRMLTEILAEEDEAALFPPLRDGAPSEPDDVWQDEDRVPDARRDPVRRRNLMIGLAVLGVGVLIVLGYLGVQLGSLFGEGRGAPPVVVGSGPPSATGPAEPGARAPVTNASLSVYDPSGDGDNSDAVSRATDGDPATVWKTQEYRQQLPALKPGVGLMASFVSTEQLADLTIESQSPGTVLEVRTAPTADAEFGQTVPVTTVTLQQGRTTIPLTQSQPTQHLLLWITKLGGGGSTYVSDIGEIAFDRAAP